MATFNAEISLELDRVVESTTGIIRMSPYPQNMVIRRTEQDTVRNAIPDLTKTTNVIRMGGTTQAELVAELTELAQTKQYWG